MTALGKSAEEVGDMTVQDALDCFHYWRRVPPVGELVLVALGGKLDLSDTTSTASSAAAAQRLPSEQELRFMAEMMNGRR
jgi:hypothetical protein